MKISVIVPVYNLLNEIEKCVYSIINQTFTNLEIILIDDGSTDGTSEELNEFVKIDARVIVKHKQNGGVSSARNLGLKFATGDYIAFVDGDDIIAPNMYEELSCIAEKFQVDIVTSSLNMNGTILDSYIKNNYVYYKSEVFNTILPKFASGDSIGLFAFTNKLFKSNLIKDNQICFGEGIDWQEDLMFMIDVFAKTNSIYSLPDAFYNYVPMANGLSRKYRQKFGQNVILSFKEIQRKIELYNIPNIDDIKLRITFLYNITWFIYKTMINCNRSVSKQLITAVMKDDTVLTVCKFLSINATSFDKRISKSIVKGYYTTTTFLVRFVHSGKAAKLQKVIAKFKKS